MREATYIVTGEDGRILGEFYDANDAGIFVSALFDRYYAEPIRLTICRSFDKKEEKGI